MSDFLLILSEYKLYIFLGAAFFIAVSATIIWRFRLQRRASLPKHQAKVEVESQKEIAEESDEAFEQKGEVVRGETEAKTDLPAAPAAQAGLPVRSTQTGLESAMESKQETKQTIQNRATRLEELQAQRQEAMQSAEKAKEELDALLAIEAKTVAELEVTITVKEKTINEIEKIRNRVQQFHAQLEEAKNALKKVNDDLKSAIKEEAEAKFAAEMASAELSAVKEAEAKATAELNAANVEVEETKQKIEQIKKRVDALKTELEATRIGATNAKDELYAARVAEGKILAELSMLKADEQRAKALIVDVNSRISELQSEIKQSPRPPLVKGEHSGKVKEEPEVDKPKRMGVDEAILKKDEEKAVEQKINNSSIAQKRCEGKNKNQPSKRAEVYKLLDAGHSIAEIAQALDMGQGEVELLMKFRGVRG